MPDERGCVDLRVKHLPRNVRGRDFVVGDLHGMVALLNVLLDQVKFDPAVDRLLSVGDLVDRGDDSPAALALLDQSWFYAVLGNHEELLLDYLSPPATQEYQMNGGRGHAFLLNGGRAWYPTNPISDETEGRLRDLPTMLVVGAGSPQRFHVVHGSLVKAYFDDSRHIQVFTDREIDRGLPWRTTREIVGYGEGDVKNGLLWDRTLPTVLRNTLLKKVPPSALFGDLSDVSPVYCGHTPTTTPCILGRHYCVDTGGFQTATPNAGLSITEVGSPTLLTVSRDDAHGRKAPGSGIRLESPDPRYTYHVVERTFLDYDRETRVPGRGR